MLDLVVSCLWLYGGNLQIRLLGKAQLNESTVKYFFMQLALAIIYCHESEVVHRDLKPDNIVLECGK